MRNWLARLAVLASLGLGAAARAETSESVELEWRWDVPRRLYIESEVVLPVPIWFVAEFNKERRVVAFQVRAVLGCDPGEVERRRVREVDCTIEDIALVAAGLPKKQGEVLPILEEHDQRLTGAALQVQIRDDGRIVNVDLEGLDRRNQRVGAMNENLRLVLSRALAGLDLALPRNGVVEGEVWPQYQNWLMQTPSAVGGSGSAEILHKLRDRRFDGTWLVETGGRGMIVPGGGANKYDTEVVGFAIFDPAAGFVRERAWNAVGVPTASSALAEGYGGLRYVQRGRLKLLADGEQVGVGETMEATPPGATPSTLQAWPTMGAVPNARP